MRKLLVLCLTMTMLLSLSLSCIVAESEYPDELTIFCYLSEHISKVGAQSLNDTFMFQEMERITGTKVTWIHPAVGSDVDAQINLMVASNDLPDLIVRSNWKSFGGSPTIWAEDGIIYDLTDLIPEYMPNYWSYLSEQEYAIRDLSVDGKMYYISEIQHGMPFSGPIYRADWLEKLGLDYPETLDELYEVLVAFRDRDPNGNGQKDEWAMSGLALQNGNFSPAYVIHAYGICLDFMQINGVVTYGALQPEFADAMAYMHKLYAEGLLDPDYATQDRNALDGKFMNDLVGFEWGIQPSKMNNALADTTPFRAVGGPNFKLTPDGKPYVFHPMYISALTSNCDTVVTTACKEPGKALHWIDFLYGGEGSILANFGIENESFVYVDGVPTSDFTGGIAKHPKYTEDELRFLYRIVATSVFPMRMAYESYAAALHPNSREGVDRWNATADTSRMLPNIALTIDETEQINDKLVDIETYISIQYDKLINGQTSLNEIPNIQKTLVDMGINDCIAIYQAALDRYMGN